MTCDAMVVDVSHDWMLACDVQQRFMGGMEPGPGAPDFSARCRQMHALGGDCYDYVRLEDRRLALTIGDATGHGIAAALKIANAHSSLRTAALFAGTNLASVVEAVNRQVYASSLAQWFATLFHGVYDGGSWKMRYVNAGHNPPMVIRHDHSVEWLEAGGAPVGIFAEGRYQEGEVSLSPGDRVVAYTDGVVEAINPDGEDWGVGGLRRAATQCCAQSAGEVVQSIFASMDEFSQGCQHDDATVLVLRVN